MSVELATAYVSIVPSAKGFASHLAKEFDGLPDEVAKKGETASSGFLSKFGSFAKGGALAAGALVGGLIAKGLQGAMETEVANDRLAAQMGLPPDRARELGSVAGKLYGQAYGESLTEVNDSIRSVLTDGLLSEDATTAEIEALTAKVMDFSNAMGEDVTASTRAVSQMLRTGLAKDADEALDILTRGYQQGNNKAEDLLDTMNEYGTLFRNVGLDGNDAMGLIQQGLQGGARDADKVADAIKEFSIRAVDGSELSAQSFEALGFSAEEMTAKIAAGGPSAKEGLDQVLDALRATEDPAKRAQIAVGLFGTQAEDLGNALYSLDLTTAAKGMGDVEGAAAKLGDTLNDNATVKLEAFKRQALQGLTNLVSTYVIPALTKVGTIFQEHILPRLQAFGEYVQANILPVLASVGQFILEHLVSAIQAVASWIQGTAIPALEAFWEWLGPVLAPTIQAVRDQFDALAPKVEALFSRIQADLVPVLERLWGIFQDKVLPVLKFVAEVILTQVIPTAIALQTKVQGYLIPVLGALVTAISTVVSWAIDLGVKLKDAAVRVVEFVSGIKDRVQDAYDYVREIPGRIQDALGNLGSTLYNAGKDLIRGFIDGIRDTFGEVKGALGDLTGRLTDWKGPPERDATILFGAGQLIIQGLMDGIDSQTGALKRQLQGLTTEMSATISAPSLGYTAEPLGSAPVASGGAGVVVQVTNPAPRPKDIGDAVAWGLRTSGRS